MCDIFGSCVQLIFQQSYLNYMQSGLDTNAIYQQPTNQASHPLRTNNLPAIQKAKVQETLPLRVPSLHSYHAFIIEQLEIKPYYDLTVQKQQSAHPPQCSIDLIESTRNDQESEPIVIDQFNKIDKINTISCATEPIQIKNISQLNQAQQQRFFKYDDPVSMHNFFDKKKWLSQQLQLQMTDNLQPSPYDQNKQNLADRLETLAEIQMKAQVKYQVNSKPKTIINNQNDQILMERHIVSKQDQETFSQFSFAERSKYVPFRNIQEENSELIKYKQVHVKPHSIVFRYPVYNITSSGKVIQTYKQITKAHQQLKIKQSILTETPMCQPFKVNLQNVHTLQVYWPNTISRTNQLQTQVLRERELQNQTESEWKRYDGMENGLSLEHRHHQTSKQFQRTNIERNIQNQQRSVAQMLTPLRKYKLKVTPKTNEKSSTKATVREVPAFTLVEGRSEKSSKNEAYKLKITIQNKRRSACDKNQKQIQIKQAGCCKL